MKSSDSSMPNGKNKTVKSTPNNRAAGRGNNRTTRRITIGKKKKGKKNKKKTGVTSTSRAITLGKNGNGVPDDDPRWVIEPHFKYLRSQTALLKPLTRQELNVLTPDKQLRGHQRTIDNTKYNYECEKHEDRLLNFREEQSMKTYKPTPPRYTEPENDFDNLDYITNPRNMNLHEVRGMINLFNQHLRDPSTQPYEIREIQDRLDELHDRENELRQEARKRSPRVHDRRRHDSGAKASTVPLKNPRSILREDGDSPKKKKKVRFQQDQHNQKVIRESKRNGDNVYWPTNDEDTDGDKDTPDIQNIDCEYKPRLVYYNHVHRSERAARRTNILSTHAEEPAKRPRKSKECEFDEPIRRGALDYFDYHIFTDILDLPNGLWCPATNHPRPVGHTRLLNKTNDNADKSSSLRKSERHGHRLLQAYVDYRTPDGTIRKGRIQLDTQSNINYVKSEVALPRERRPWEATHVIGIGQKPIKLGRTNSFTMMKNGEPMAIDTVKAPSDMFTDDCIALLGLDAITMMGIDLNYHIGIDRHVDIRYLPDTYDNAIMKRAKEKAIHRYPKTRQLEREIYKETYLSERVCQEYLKQHPGDYESKPIPEDSIVIAPHVQQNHRERINGFLFRYEKVFANRTNTLPRPMEGVPPHRFKLIPGATPTTVPRPRFGPSQAEIINEWVEWARDEDLIERATTTSWSSRLVLAAKYKSSTPKSSLPDGIRVAWARTEANSRIQKTVPTYPDAWEQMYKVAHYKYKFSADGLKQYWSIPLHKDSREVTAFWTPTELWQFKRLVMGTKNAATVAQNA